MPQTKYNATGTVVSILLALIGMLFSYLAHLYSQLPFNEQDRYYDVNSSIVLHAQSVSVFILAAIIFTSAAILRFYFVWKAAQK